MNPNSPKASPAASITSTSKQIESRHGNLVTFPVEGMAPLSAHDATPSSAPSTTSTSDLSDYRNGDQLVIPQHGLAQLAIDDDAQGAKRPSVVSRLSRMFSSTQTPKTKTRNKSTSHSRSPERKPDGASTGTVKPLPDAANPHRQSVVDQKDHKEAKDVKDRKTSIFGGSKDKVNEINGSNTAATQRKRFEQQDDGTHTHYLKSAKRQEKLSGMLSSMLGGGKKKDVDGGDADHQLSLMSNWVDQLKSERSPLATNDKRGGPNATAGLVEKYGKCQEVVGQGAFGIVRISHKQHPTKARAELLYAVKEFRKRPQESPKSYKKRLASEFCISSSLRHPNIIHTLDLMEDAKGDLCEVMEYCAGGDVYSLVLAAGHLQVLEADCLFKQLMRGVEYMHQMGVAHRDLKPENLILTTHGSLKITDFGNGECFRTAWEKEAHLTAGLCGSAPYIAPEEYGGGEFDARAVDVWACGVIYMAMRTGRHLWRQSQKDEDEFYERYLEGRKDEAGYAPIETLHRARCRNVIYSILDPNPGRRITAGQVLKSEWGREIRVCKAGTEGF